MKRTIPILLISVIFALKGVGQTSLPNVIPPSPEVSQLFKYQDYPVDYSTGLPQIEIPLYNIKSSQLEVPITLSYHASGRRVSDQNGPIALGWSLNAGGMVSRTVYGSPDFGIMPDGTYKFPYPFTVSGLPTIIIMSTSKKSLISIKILILPQVPVIGWIRNMIFFLIILAVAVGSLFSKIITM